MNTNFETSTQTVATAIKDVPLSSSGEKGLTRRNFNDLGLPWTANLTKAFHCIRAAKREERNGFTYTAAMKWRNAAELFAPSTRAVEYCWREWERIMGLPRQLAGPIGFFTSAELPLIQSKKRLQTKNLCSRSYRLNLMSKRSWPYSTLLQVLTCMKPMDSYTPIAFTALPAISEALVKPNGICISALAN